MDNKRKTYTITSALPYANGPLHIGHLAGCFLPADIYSRFLRISGNDVLFLSGSDEHGVPITISAMKENCSPQEVADKYHEHMKNCLYAFGIDFDIYSRTSSELHKKVSSDFFLKLYNSGLFDECYMEQYYDAANDQFLADRYVKGICPHCENTDSYGDQCEKCGATISPQELINPKSSITSIPLTLKKTKHWYLPLNKYEKWLREWICEHSIYDWKHTVTSQCKSWLDQGLKPRAMTRDLSWGVPVPLKEAEGKVLYVWFDAPIGYISATIEYAQKKNIDWERYWKNKETELVHFIGKDNIVFHCIIFPTMLKAHGDFILPKNVPANEFLNLEGKKISTSKNWAIWLHDYLQDLPDMQDSLRYALCVNMPEKRDCDFTWRDFQARNNNELVSILGNFINRVLILIEKFFDSKVPEYKTLLDCDAATLKSIILQKDKIQNFIMKFEFKLAISEAMELARIGNKYLAENEPWSEVKKDRERAGAILYIAIQLVGALQIVLYPFLPFFSKNLAKILAISADMPDWKKLENIEIIAQGHKLGKTAILFAKIDDAVIEKQINKLVTE